MELKLFGEVSLGWTTNQQQQGQLLFYLVTQLANTSPRPEGAIMTQTIFN